MKTREQIYGEEAAEILRIECKYLYLLMVKLAKSKNLLANRKKMFDSN